MTVIGPATMDIYLPGLPELTRGFDVTNSVAQLTISTFLLGLALGQFLAGPLSDMFGRRRPALGGMALFAVVSTACALAPDVYTLAAMRFFQGLLAASGMAIGRAIVRDLYSGVKAAQYLSRTMLIVGLGPMLAPVVGGQILRLTSWRGVFVAIAVFGLLLALTGARWLPETNPPERRQAAGVGSAARIFVSLLLDRRFIGFVILGGFGGGAMFAYIAGSSFVLEDVYGASPQLYSFLFGVNALCLVIAAQVNAHLLGRFPVRRLLSFGLACMVSAGVWLVVAVGLDVQHVWAIVAPLSLLTISWSFIASNATALALTDHPHVAGSAAGLLGVAQSTVGALAAPLVGLGGKGSAMPMALTVLGCGLVSAFALTVLVLPRVRPQAAPAAARA
jgi:DHA1 family bicyclomycin/chloramphenicol resistance-like MFS transporter